MSYSKTFLNSRLPAEIGEMSGLNNVCEVKTGHRTFDRQANDPKTGYVGTGNVSSSVQRSTFVRAFSKTLCNGRENEPGALQKFDLEPFQKSISPAALAQVRELAQDDDVILYKFHTNRRSGSRDVHGWVISDTFHRHLASIPVNDVDSKIIIGEIAKRVSWSDEGLSDPVPAEEIRALCEGMTGAEFVEIARHLGYDCAEDSQSCRRSGLAFNENKPLSAWKEHDPAWTMVRSDNVADLAALVFVREEISPLIVNGIREFPESMSKSECEPS